ncbi:hypothetical protein D3C72_2142240 [compost metagenome]
MLEVVFALFLSTVVPAQEAETNTPPPTIAYMAQRRRVMALVADRDCEQALGAVFVMADREMLEMVESVCPMSAFDLARWDIYNADALDGFYTQPQMETARRLYDAYRFGDVKADGERTD